MVMGANNLPANVQSGSVIGPGGQFGKPTSYGLLFTYGKGNFSHVQGGGTKTKHRGNLSLTQDSYIGFEFSQSGKAHYGWIRLSVGFHGQTIKQTLVNALNFGYESTPDTPINAGSCSGSSNSEPSVRNDASDGASLGMLALGSVRVANWEK